MAEHDSGLVTRTFPETMGPRYMYIYLLGAVPSAGLTIILSRITHFHPARTGSFASTLGSLGVPFLIENMTVSNLSPELQARPLFFFFFFFFFFFWHMERVA